MGEALARFAWPRADLCPSTGLYAHLERASYREGVLELAPGGSASFNTYFNSFGVGKWLRHTGLRNLSLRLLARGPLEIEVIHDRPKAGRRVLACREVSGSEPTWHTLALPPITDLGDGSVYARVVATGGVGEVQAGEWSTDDSPARTVRLGVVITTYNRQAQLEANLVRLGAALRDDPAWRHSVRVVVVDNASNVAFPSPPGLPLTMLANPNVGGAGGFARGLIHLRDGGWATHVLFMDDDVSFDPEILRRTVHLLARATDTRLCLSGAMLSSGAPTMLFEAGARFSLTATSPLKSLHRERQLLDWREVLAADTDLPIDYGAWWYFAFPLDLTPDNPMPMFVHGDDVCWGLLHAGEHTITCNGIGLWHDDFELKNGPSVWFYGMRNFALISILAAPRLRARHLLGRYLYVCARNLLSFRYASAANVTFGLRELLAGPEHWLTVDHAALHETVRSVEGEAIETLDPSERSVPLLPLRSGLPKYAHAAFSAATLGGNLLPGWARRKAPGAAPVQQRVLGETALRDRIVYRDPDHGVGFVAERHRRTFFRSLATMLTTAARIPFRFRRLAREYRRAYPRMVSDAYWRAQFTPAAPPPAAASAKPADALRSRAG